MRSLGLTVRKLTPGEQLRQIPFAGDLTLFGRDVSDLIRCRRPMSSLASVPAVQRPLDRRTRTAAKRKTPHHTRHI
jgi:hypothetical protein